MASMPPRVAYPPAPPPYVAPVDPNAGMLKELVIESGGRTYHIPGDVACRLEAIRSIRVLVSEPSRRVTVIVPCDGPTTLDQVQDDPAPMPFPRPIVAPSPRKK